MDRVRQILQNRFQRRRARIRVMDRLIAEAMERAQQAQAANLENTPLDEAQPLDDVIDPVPEVAIIAPADDIVNPNVAINPGAALDIENGVAQEENIEINQFVEDQGHEEFPGQPPAEYFYLNTSHFVIFILAKHKPLSANLQIATRWCESATRTGSQFSTKTYSRRNPEKVSPDLLQA